MRPLLFALALWLSFAAACTPSLTSAVSLAPRNPIEQAGRDSVYPLLDKNHNIFCTAFSINERAGYWMTARHCAQSNTVNAAWEATIDNQWALVIYRDPAHDIAVIQSAARHPALKMASRGSEPGDAAVIIGYPWGMPRGQSTTFGHIAALLVPIENWYPSDIYDITVAPGNSGSPVLNLDGRIVGLVWGRFEASNHTLAMSWDDVRRVWLSFQ